MENLNEIIQGLSEDQQNEVAEFVQSLMARGAKRPKTRLRQDWAGKLSGAAEGKSMLDLQRSAYPH